MPLLKGGRLGRLIGSGGSIVRLLWDDFVTAVGALLAGTRNAEPGPGQWTVVDTTGLQLSITGGRLKQTGTPTAGFTDPRITSLLSYARQKGRAAVFRVNNDSAMMVGWCNNSGGGTANMRHALFLGATTMNFYASSGGTSVQVADISSGVDYYLVIIERDTGCIVYILGGSQYPTWTPIFVQDAYTDTPLYATVGYSGAGTRYLDIGRVADLGQPFSDDSVALISLPGTAQSIAANSFANSGFITWSGNNPVSWIVNAEAVNQTVDESAIDGTVGTGYAHFVKTTGVSSAPSIQQAIGSLGDIVEFEISITANAGASGIYIDNAFSDINAVLTGTGIKRVIGRLGGVAAGRVGAYSSVNADFVLDYFTGKVITQAPSQLATGDGIWVRNFTLPGTPQAGDITIVWFRMPTAGSPFVNGWFAKLFRNDANTSWTLTIGSYSGGGETIGRTVTGITAADQLEVIALGNTIRVYAKNSQNYAKYGADIVDGLYATNQYVNYTDGSAITPGTFRAYSRPNAATLAQLDALIN